MLTSCIIISVDIHPCVNFDRRAIALAHSYTRQGLGAVYIVRYCKFYDINLNIYKHFVIVV